MMLTIDTSGARSGLAITQDQRVLAELQWESGRRHSEQVLPQIDDLCRLVAVAPQDFRHIVVALGPGSWSGIRVGISIAKGLALGTEAPIIGVATLDALAWQLRGTTCTAVLSMGRGRYAVAHYPAEQWVPGTISASNQAEINGIDQHSIVCDPDTAQSIRGTLPDAPLHVVWPRPLTYAQIGGEIRDAQDATSYRYEPIYLGDPVQRT